MAFPHTRGKEDGVGEKAGVFHGFSTGVLGKMGRGWGEDLVDGAGFSQGTSPGRNVTSVSPVETTLYSVGVLAKASDKVERTPTFFSYTLIKSPCR